MPGLPALAVSAVCSGVPQPLRTAVEAAAGPVLDTVEAAAGRTARLPLSLDVPGRRLFLDAIPLSHRYAPALGTKARLIPARSRPGCCATAPPTPGGGCCSSTSGRAADLSPGSACRDAARALRRLAVLPAPVAATLRAEDRWAHLGAGLELGLLVGDRFVHTDLNEGTILVQGDDSACLLDTAWPGRGTGGLSASFLLAQLNDAGTPAADAEAWASWALPGWASSPTDAPTPSSPRSPGDAPSRLLSSSGPLCRARGAVALRHDLTPLPHPHLNHAPSPTSFSCHRRTENHVRHRHSHLRPGAVRTGERTGANRRTRGPDDPDLRGRGRTRQRGPPGGRSLPDRRTARQALPRAGEVRLRIPVLPRAAGPARDCPRARSVRRRRRAPRDRTAQRRHPRAARGLVRHRRAAASLRLS